MRMLRSYAELLPTKTRHDDDGVRRVTESKNNLSATAATPEILFLEGNQNSGPLDRCALELVQHTEAGPSEWRCSRLCVVPGLPAS